MQIIRDNLPRNAFVKFECDRGETVCVYPGRLSEFDIIVKYRQNGSRERTPKHIHWVADLLLKKQVDPRRTNLLLDHFLNIWNNCRPITNNNERQQLGVQYSNYSDDLNRLNNHGYYSTEFLVLVAELLMRQEKTNRPDAYMFFNVLDKLRNSNDLFSIISTATHGRRRR